MQKVHKRLTMFLQKTSSNTQKLMPFKVFQHNPKIHLVQSYKVRVYNSNIFILTLKNPIPSPLLKVPNGNPAETLWSVRFFTKNTLGNLLRTLGKPWETLGKWGKSLLDTLCSYGPLWVNHTLYAGKILIWRSFVHLRPKFGHFLAKIDSFESLRVFDL